jgi:hypothetical protein
MLVALGVGRERTAEHYARLLDDAGFAFIAAHPAATHHIIETVTR